MKIRIGTAELTTEHPASSYGVPALLVDGVAYGPQDLLPPVCGCRHMAGSVMAVHAPEGEMDAEAVDALCGWFRQSPQHGARWEKMVRSRWADRDVPVEL